MSAPSGCEQGPDGWIVPPPGADAYQTRSEKGQANGYAALGADAKVPSEQLPAGGAEGAEGFPVGSIFLSVLPTSPDTLLGYGTWSELPAGFALVTVDPADEELDAAENTGGANEATPAGSVSQPTFTGNALSGHAHGAGTLVPSAHAGAAVSAHSGSAVSAHSGSAVADHASHTHTYTQVPNHVHVQRLQGGTTGATTGTHLMGSTATGGSLRNAGQSTLDPTGGVATGTTNGPGAALTHSVTQPADHTVTQPANHTVTQPSDHTMSGSSQSVSAGTPEGTVSQPSFTGSPLSVRQKSIAVHAWKRTA